MLKIHSYGGYVWQVYRCKQTLDGSISAKQNNKLLIEPFPKFVSLLKPFYENFEQVILIF